MTCEAMDGCCNDTPISQTNQEHKDDDHKPVSPCNPFFPCGSCHSVITPEIKIDFQQPYFLGKKLYFFYSEASLTGLSFSFWQPPQIS